MPLLSQEAVTTGPGLLLTISSYFTGDLALFHYSKLQKTTKLYPSFFCTIAQLSYAAALLNCSDPTGQGERLKIEVVPAQCAIEYDKSLQGGYSTVNCLYNITTNGCLENEASSQMTFFDGVSLYSSILSLAHPYSSYMMLDLEHNTYLFRLYEERILNYDTSFFAQEKKFRNFLFFATVHVNYCPDVAKWTTVDYSSFPVTRNVAPNELSLLQRKWLLSSKRNSATQSGRLVSSCHPKVISQHLELLFYECLFLGCSIIKVDKIIRAKGFPIFKNYIDNLNKQRQAENSVVHSKILKALSNCLAGKLHMDTSKKLKSVVVQNKEQFSKAVNDDFFFDICRLG